MIHRLLLFLLLGSFSYEAAAQFSVYGRVVETTTGEPIEGAVVFIHDEFNIAIHPAIRDTTDLNGEYELKLPDGSYHIGVYATYKMEKKSYMMVYQPGIISPPSSPHFMKEGIRIDLGLSEIEFRYLYLMKQSESGQSVPFSEQDRGLYYSNMHLSFCRVYTNAGSQLNIKPISFIEELVLVD